MRAKVRRVKVDRPKKEPLPKRWTGSILDLHGIGQGISGLVLIIDETRVIKVPYGNPRSKQDLETEHKAYSILGRATRPSPHILKCLDLNNPQGLVFERCHETVRHRLMAIPADAILPDHDLRKWSKQAAAALAFVHSHEIVHGDVGCNNMLLDWANNLKLCDFAGSSVQGSKASTVYEIWSRLPIKNTDNPTIASDLFALGSAIYELSTKERPYYQKTRLEIRELFERQQFPSVNNDASLRHVIINCWHQKYSSASDVVFDISHQSSGRRSILENECFESTLGKDSSEKTSKAVESGLSNLSSIAEVPDTQTMMPGSSPNSSLSWLSTSGSSSSPSSSSSCES